MNDLFWFGVTFGFTCQICGKRSEEKHVVAHPTSKQDEMNQRIRERLWLCQSCGMPIVVGSEVNYDVVRGTPEELRSKGFTVPR